MPSPVRSAQQIGQLIAAARRQKKLSQRAVADQLGVTQNWISQVERGHQLARLGQVLRLASWLGLEITAALPKEIPSSPRVADYPDIDKVL